MAARGDELPWVGSLRGIAHHAALHVIKGAFGALDVVGEGV
jgi:hypothetical protein